MGQFSSPNGEGKGRSGLTGWLARRLLAAGERLFAADDQAARDHGWQITRHHGGLSRQYREPRFDLLARCSRCQGSGRARGLDCPVCGGTGRLTLARPPVTRIAGRG
jgi:diadenosine tetraphosphatase ApaH/serine/threonine PP2A family protein phosphatase